MRKYHPVKSRRRLDYQTVIEIRSKCAVNKNNIGRFASRLYMSWASIQKIVLRKTYVDII